MYPNPFGGSKVMAVSLNSELNGPLQLGVKGGNVSPEPPKYPSWSIGNFMKQSERLTLSTLTL